MTSYRIEFARIGADHEVAPLEVHGVADAHDDLVFAAVLARARAGIGSTTLEVRINRADLRGYLAVGPFRNGGEFTLTEIEAPARPSSASRSDQTCPAHLTGQTPQTGQQRPSSKTRTAGAAEETR